MHILIIVTAFRMLFRTLIVLICVLAARCEPYTPVTYRILLRHSTTAVFKCVIPYESRSRIKFDAWVKIDGQTKTYLRAQEGHKRAGTPTYAVMHAPLHQLLLFNATEENVGRSRYACQVKDMFTGQIFVSKNGLKVPEIVYRRALPPFIQFVFGTLMCSEGESADLPCVAGGVPAPTYSWYKVVNGKREAVADSDGRVSVTQGVLMFRPALIADSGLYVCIAKNWLREDRAETGLSVRPPFTLEMHPRQQMRKLGETVVISCNISRTPMSVAWVKDGELLHLSQKKYKVSNNTLHINDVRFNDKGIYQCFATDGVSDVQGTSELAIAESIPIVTLEAPDPTLSGGNVTMKCIARGNPLPTITWYIYDKSLTGNVSRLTISHQEIKSEDQIISYLNITNTTTKDGGRYSCKAQNKEGSASRNGRLNIIGSIYVHPMPGIVAKEGSTITLECPYSGYPVQSIRWIKDGAEVRVNNYTTISPEGVLVITSVLRDFDEGKYECEVSGMSKANVVTGHANIIVLGSAVRNRCPYLTKSAVLLNRAKAAVTHCSKEQIVQSSASAQQFRNTVTTVLIILLIKLTNVAMQS